MFHCPKCTGNHRIHDCPQLIREMAKLSVHSSIKQDFHGASPNVFVGKFGYPHLNVGILSPVHSSNAWLYDAPRYWSQQDFSINDIMSYRLNLVNSSFKTNIKTHSKMMDLAQEIGMSCKPVDIDVSLVDKPVFRMDVDSFHTPSGPKGELKSAILTSNPSIDRKVDKVISDTDWNASEGLKHLYDKGYDEVFLTKLFSTGNMGVPFQRKITPTRWSITATDDILAKHLIEEIKMYDQKSHLAFFGQYLGNYYIILLIPDIWSYELFEMHVGGTEIYTDYEDYEGRKDYATQTVGGYYAARLPILEKLTAMKCQASVLAIRFIAPEYTLPLGVFVVREAVRKCMKAIPIEFSSKELMLTYATHLAKRKFGYDLSPLLGSSKILRRMKEQKKLWEFH